MAKQNENTAKVTIRRDGTIRFWNVFEQQWNEQNVLELLSQNKRVFATIPEDQRKRVRECGNRFGGAF